jgi:hypothetical protein
MPLDYPAPTAQAPDAVATDVRSAATSNQALAQDAARARAIAQLRALYVKASRARRAVGDCAVRVMFGSGQDDSMRF